MTKRTRPQSFVIALALCTSCFLAACALLGGQTGQESKEANSSCGGGSAKIADSDDRTIGASPRDVADALRGPLHAPFSWTKLQTTTQVTVELDYAGGAAHSYTNEHDCEVGISLDVTLAIKTDDGRLDEHVSATLFATAADSGKLDVTLALGELHGDYDASEVAGASADSSLQIAIEWAGAATHGSLDVLSNRSLGDGTGSIDRDRVGTW